MEAKSANTEVSLETKSILLRRNLANVVYGYWSTLSSAELEEEFHHALSMVKSIAAHTETQDFSKQIEIIRNSGLPESTIRLALADLEKKASTGTRVDVEEVDEALKKFGCYLQYEMKSADGKTTLPNRIMVLEEHYTVKRGRSATAERLAVPFEVGDDKALPVKVYSSEKEVTLVIRDGFDRGNWRYLSSTDGQTFANIEFGTDENISSYLKGLASVKLVGYAGMDVLLDLK